MRRKSSAILMSDHYSISCAWENVANQVNNIHKQLFGVYGIFYRVILHLKWTPILPHLTWVCGENVLQDSIWPFIYLNNYLYTFWGWICDPQFTYLVERPPWSGIPVQDVWMTVRPTVHFHRFIWERVVTLCCCNYDINMDGFTLNSQCSCCMVAFLLRKWVLWAKGWVQISLDWGRWKAVIWYKCVVY